MYLPICEYNMVPVVDSSLLTQNPQFVFFHHVGTALSFPGCHSCSSHCCCSHGCCCFCCCYYFCFCSCLHCSLYAVLLYYIRPPTLLKPIPCSFLCMIIHNKNSFLCRRDIQWTFRSLFMLGRSITWWMWTQRTIMVKQLSMRLARIRTMMTLHVSLMDIEAEHNGEAQCCGPIQMHPS